ncbi:hypothetical protein GCM10027343_34320 [Noviherbaspirillum agri]
MPAAPTKLQLLPPELEEQLRSKHESDVDQLLPIVGPVLGMLMIGFGLRDYLIDPEHAGQAFLLRVAAVVISVIAFRRTTLGWTPTQRAGFIYWIYASALIGVSSLLKDGAYYGLITISASIFLVTLTSLRISTFLWIASGPFFLYAVVAAREMSFIAYLNDIVSYLLNACLALVLMLMFRFFRQKAFLLELQLTHVARHDALTSLYNRGHFNELAAQEIMRARRHQRPLAVAMLDIDRFKNINDTYGHEIGDLALKAFADACRGCVRETDRLGRIGGEEFACLLPETSESEAIACAERLRTCIEDLRVDTPKGKIQFTVSIGVAVLQPEHMDWDCLLRDADSALYQAKCEGRNRVVLAKPCSSRPPHGVDAA